MDWVVLVVLLPAMLLFGMAIALWIKLVARGPVFIAEPRIGSGGKTFRLYKFRCAGAGSNPGPGEEGRKRPMQAGEQREQCETAGDTPMIPGGGFLKAWGLDELPQVLNVVRGEMSIIGPRPATTEEYALYRPWHQARLRTRPGLAGLWQVAGKHQVDFDEMLKLDIYYVEHLSLGLDLKILWMTLPVLFRQAPDRGPRREGVPLPGSG